MTAPAHPQRCDTCEYYQEDDGVCENPIFLNQGIALILGEERYGLIYEVGCASHSSAQSPIPNDEQCQICSQSIHNLVLDAVICHFKKFDYPGCDYIPPKEIVEYLALLRTQGSRDQ